MQKQENAACLIQEQYEKLTNENKRKFDTYVEMLLKSQDCELSKS